MKKKNPNYKGNPNFLLIRNNDPTSARLEWVRLSRERNTKLIEVIEAWQEQDKELVSLRQIAAKLNSEGYKPVRGFQFVANSVRRILNSN